MPPSTAATLLLLCSCVFAAAVPASAPAGFNCNFDAGFCGWTQSAADQMDWTRGSGRTPSAGTGPVPQTGPETDRSGKGSYIFFEASNGQDGNQAVLESPEVKWITAQGCVTLYFNMVGLNIGPFRVLLVKADPREPPVELREETAESSPGWTIAEMPFDIGIPAPFKIQLVAEKNDGWAGDIAVDDVSIKPGPCQAPPTKPPTTPGWTTRAPTTTPRPSTITGGCFQWTGSLQDSAFLAACVHGNVSLPWTFTLGSCATLQYVKWNFRSNKVSQEQVAEFVAGNFVAMPAFSQRVKYLTNGGLVLSHATPQDSGSYSVEVAVRNTANVVTYYKRTADVLVTDVLRVRQKREAVYKPETDSWHATLVCGVTAREKGSRGHIMWKTPSGVVPSTTFKDGVSYLLLENPVMGGNYSCGLSPNATASVCLPVASRREAMTVVNELEAKVIVLEAESKDRKNLKIKVAQLEARLDSLQRG